MSIIGIDIGSSTTKVIEYKNEEIKNNPRSRSEKMRIAQKL